METFKKPFLFILGVLLAFAVLLFFLVNPENQLLFPKCPIHHHMGIYCSGCGSQRAFHDLLHFRIGKVFGHNFLFLPFLVIVSQHVLAKTGILRQKSLLSYRYTPILILIVVIVFTVLRNIGTFPFTYLAP